jgi:FlaA1/EpsC-like NDP-sugar epimerase
MSRILITGGAGSIGSELVRQLSPKHKIFILDNNETGMFDLCEELQHKGLWVYGRVGDVRDMSTVWDVFSDFKPQIVIHAAALKHVKPNETYPIEAIQTNVLGTYNVLQQAKNFKVRKFIFISTDKVVNANSVMGQTKKLGETMVRNAGYTAVRFGNVMGSRGSVLPFWAEQAKRGDPITITDKRMMRFFMSIPQACSLVIRAMDLPAKGKTIVLDMGKLKNVYELACELYPNHKKKFIGIRPGETLDEKLMSHEEEKNATKIKQFYVIN